ncbi:lysophospholipid acyltransferase LPEAT2-like [Juglans microcarpa x Juglans regia]|uniref:lysophospholipid acyltransferase LPEAT2-like n=1 Tax=Juglans microcarpa x Juglans regia TaxID=2249226 RepID=UPI001B7EFA69|nr:lysophospholipid acyltransferase LPEAT2-like [Juglans microcarpa x Juglans regia]XP_040999445.1 lysophospholipid acyltransferase LPEAT2-like [Juglans microcarpa x Juglans regia]
MQTHGVALSLSLSQSLNFRPSDDPSAMADHDISSPLLSSQPSDTPHLTIIVNASDSDNHPNNKNINNDNNGNHQNGRDSHSRNPFELIGSKGLEVPGPATVDPFRNETPTIDGLYEWVKIVVCLPIAAVRLVLFGVCLLVGFLATKLALEGWKDKQNPLPRWRSRIMWVTRVCARCILFSFGYHWIRRKGKPAPRETAPIVVSNHVSFIEPIFYFYELFPTIVAAESHDSIPFVGTIIRAMQVIYVNRFSPSSRKHAVNEIKRKASCDGFPRLLLFPEGTTTNGSALISFQLGAFIPGYPIQPVVIRYPYVHFDQSWGNISLAKLMFRMFTQFHNFMEVEYLPVVSPLTNRKESIIHLAERTSHAIATALNVTETSHSYGDLMLLTKALQSKQEKPSSYMVEMARVESLFHISSLEAVDFLDKFLSMNPDPSGCVRFYDFLSVLRLKACALSEEIFAFIDVEKNGTITFKQFLFGSAHVMKQPLFRQACELSFTECTAGGNDYMLEHELGDFLGRGIPDLNADEVHGLFNLLDSDNDGKISKDDFDSCLRKNPLLIALFLPCLLHKGFSSQKLVLER